MKVLYALYDKDDNFIDCGFSLKEIGIDSDTAWRFCHKTSWRKLYKIPLEVQDDIFKEEDETFIKEFEQQVYTDEERAKMLGINIRTFYRRKAKEKLKGKVVI